MQAPDLEAAGTLLLGFLGALGGCVGFIVRRLDRNRDRTQEFVTGQVATVSTAVAGRLDRIDEHLADQDDQMDGLNERVARVEGALGILRPDTQRPPRRRRLRRRLL